MKILLVNDDGYKAEGILTLERVLKEKGHDVLVVAPHTQQSAKSHAMTVKGEVVMHRYDDRHYSLEGTPADCVIYPLRSNLLPFKPDVIISGINHGYNLSSDTIYSGTCAAARQGVMYSIPSIAISAEKDRETGYDFVSPGEYLSSRLESFVSALTLSDSFMNLNFPPKWNGEVKKAGLGFIHYFDDYTTDDNGERIVFRSNGCKMNFVESEDEYPGDRALALSGFATLSFIKINPVYDKEKMKEFVL